MKLFDQVELIDANELAHIKRKTEEQWDRIIDTPLEHRDIGAGALVAIMARLIVTIEKITPNADELEHLEVDGIPAIRAAAEQFNALGGGPLADRLVQTADLVGAMVTCLKRP